MNKISIAISLVLTVTVIFLFIEIKRLNLENNQIKDDFAELESLLRESPEFSSNNDTDGDEGRINHKLLHQLLYSEKKNSEDTATLSSEQIRALQLPTLLPLEGDYAVSQNFSERHQAVDFAAVLGTNVLAAGLGVIANVERHKQLGIVVEIDHLNGYRTLYAHLEKAIAKTGEPVKQGEVIGFVGNTGRSTASHLHFEIEKNGEKINPETMIGKK